MRRFKGLSNDPKRGIDIGAVASTGSLCIPYDHVYCPSNGGSYQSLGLEAQVITRTEKKHGFDIPAWLLRTFEPFARHVGGRWTRSDFVGQHATDIDRYRPLRMEQVPRCPQVFPECRYLSYLAPSPRLPLSILPYPPTVNRKRHMCVQRYTTLCTAAEGITNVPRETSSPSNYQTWIASYDSLCMDGETHIIMTPTIIAVTIEFLQIQELRFTNHSAHSRVLDAVTIRIGDSCTTVLEILSTSADTW